MYLKRLEIYGFKTFAQRTTLEFHPGVTAVVGPNGSGKSNVADAVRWVLGEQSFANLRSKRTEDLIFGGGTSRAPMGFAEVFLTIDNSDRLLALPYDEVTIGRRAYRSGENEYTINRARVRLRDVLDAVAPLGSSYTLINQGLVDAALALQPEERRRLFEDAAEIGPYQAKKHEAERRLRETETNLVRLSDLVSELEPQLRTLRRQARDAEAVGVVEAELHQLLRQHYLRQWLETTSRVTAAAEQEQRCSAELANARSSREQVLQVLQAARDELRQQRVELEQQRAAQTEVQRQRESIMRERAVAIERGAGIQRRQAELEQRRVQLDAMVVHAGEQVRLLREAVSQRQVALEAARQRLTEAEVALQQALAERRRAEDALATQRMVLLKATAALESEHVQLQVLQQRRETIVGSLAQFEQELVANRERAEACRVETRDAQQVLSVAEHRLVTAGEALESLRRTLDAARRERDDLDEQITTAKRAQNELQARHDTLNRMARSFEGTFAGVRAAMQWAEREGRHGFVLVSSLLEVPAVLETAIEVALGSRLQHVVVDQWADAEAAIAQLKRSGTGRATFLPLDTLRPGRRLIAPQLSGVRGVAADLIEVAPHYAVVAAYLLGRTLVADDLAAARRALPQLEGGWTIVTLAGEVIATGGAVTGGAATRESGTLKRERELRELPDQLAAAQRKVDALQGERQAAAQRIQATQAELQQSEAALRTAGGARDEAQRSVETRHRVLHRAEDELAAVHRRQSDVQREQTTLEQQITTRVQALAAATAAHTTAQSAAAAAEAVLHEQLAAMSDDEAALQRLRSEVALLEADMRDSQNQLHVQQEAESRATHELVALERQGQQLDDEARVVATVQAELDARQSALAQQNQVVDEHVALLQRRVQEREQQVETLEMRERELTAATLSLEAIHAEAAIERQRRRSERDAVWERAAEDAIDVEQLEAAPAHEQQTIEEAVLPQQIGQLRARLRRMGPVNALAPDEYRAAQERYTFLTEQLADVRAATNALRQAIEQLQQVMQRHFTTTFEAVARAFSRSFTQLFGGGTARLELSSSTDHEHAAGGIEIIVQPPGKRQLNLQLLSGGERALTAAALLFAILTVNPSPFCILDEVDAALDEANVVRFREALLQLAEQTQFILITHNRGTVEVANTLYGISMAEDGSSRVLSLRLEEAAEEGSLSLVG